MGTTSRTLTMRITYILGALLVVFVTVDADRNVFDEPLARCGSHKSCMYHARDQGAHEICVDKLPPHFSAKTGQGNWSDRFTGKKWCVCIWAYSNYILKHNDLRINCKAIPSKVLEERYSLKKFAQCGKMSSTKGCGPEDIRRSIDKICSQCRSEARGRKARRALRRKCAKIKGAAHAAGHRKSARTAGHRKSAHAAGHRKSADEDQVLLQNFKLRGTPREMEEDPEGEWDE